MQAIELVSTKGMDREVWLSWRNKGIGGSDAAVICGLNKYKSIVQLWLEKTGQLEAEEAGEAAYWGTVMEPLIRKEFTRRTGLEIATVSTMLQHPEHTFMLANLDGIVEDPVQGKGVFEAKTAGAYLAHQWEEGVPEYYEVQLQHYLAVNGMKFGYVAVLLGGNRFKHLYIPRNEQVIELLIQLESHFWDLVQTNTPPEIDGSSASGELLKRLYPASRPHTLIQLPDEAEALIEQFEVFKAEEHEAMQRKDGAANKLKEMLGDHEGGVVNGRSVFWKSVTSERMNTTKFKKDCPEQYRQYVEQSSYRRFTLRLDKS